MTIDVEIDLMKTPDKCSSELFSNLLFEFRDRLTLATAERILKYHLPGEYDLIGWNDSAGQFVVNARFASLEDWMFWKLSLE